MKIIFSKFLSLLLFIHVIIPLKGADIEKGLEYNRHTLKDTYKYGKVQREFQWNVISKHLDDILAFENTYTSFGTLRNYKNRNGLPQLPGHHFVKSYKLTKSGRVITIKEDAYGVRMNQGIPLYTQENLQTPERLGKDGELIAIISQDEKYTTATLIDMPGVWLIPNKYVRNLTAKKFKKVIFVDRENQNISTLQDVGGGVWKVRSMNPCTTGMHKPPFKFETPAGTFVVQEKKPKMFYLVDGSRTKIAGYTPYATRFSGGGYLHGVPVELPKTEPIEYSYSLGTTPRSHMCVRNATSHAKFMYDWVKPFETLIVVF